MLVNSLEIVNRLYDELRSDSTLSGYVKIFRKSGDGLSRNQFPFILIDYPSYREKQLLASSGIFVYTFQIFAGTRNLAPGVAYRGSESGKKGVAEICNDIVDVIRDNSLSGTFFVPAYNIRNNPKYMFDEAETLIIGNVSFDVDIWFKHR